MIKKPACLTFAVAPVADPSGTGPMRFRGVAYSGGVIPQYGFYGDACIDLASMPMPDGELFALVDHDPTQRAGKFAARIDGTLESLRMSTLLTPTNAFGTKPADAVIAFQTDATNGPLLAGGARLRRRHRPAGTRTTGIRRRRRSRRPE